jgi:GT2 family glycosyltransferase
MPKVTIVQVIYNNRRYIPSVFESIFNQTFKDFNVVAVIAGNDDGGKELLEQKFPQVEIIDPGYNIGFAKGHNLVFSARGGSASLAESRRASGGEDPEFFQLVNPDLILEPTYIENILKVFDNPKVGAATGKLLRYDFEKGQPITSLSPSFKEEGNGPILPLGRGGVRGGYILDTTGVTISKSGRARDRGQHEVDVGQYDSLTNVDAVSGAGAMYRRSVLQTTRYSLQTKAEFFDEDFHSYWEDVDLAWRMTNAGWKCAYVPSAVGYHGRGAGSSRGGYLHIVDFIKHHRTLSPRIRQLNYQNHIFMYIKNTKWFYPQFFVREFFMFWYVLIFETSTLKVLPTIFRLLPKMWKKRKVIHTS